MNIDPLLLLEFSNAANDRVIEGLRGLTPELLLSPLRNDFLSPFGLMVHILSSERVWLDRWKGAYPPVLIMTEDIPTLDALVAAWQPLRAEMREFVEGVEDEEMDISYNTTQGVEHRMPWWQLFLHVFNHTTEHRSQVALFLATRDIDVGNLDLVWFLRERPR